MAVAGSSFLSVQAFALWVAYRALRVLPVRQALAWLPRGAQAVHAAFRSRHARRERARPARRQGVAAVARRRVRRGQAQELQPDLVAGWSVLGAPREACYATHRVVVAVVAAALGQQQLVAPVDCHARVARQRADRADQRCGYPVSLALEVSQTQARQELRALRDERRERPARAAAPRDSDHAAQASLRKIDPR